MLRCAAQLLYDTFSAFGMIITTPKIMRDPETGASRGFGFVSYDGFEASDAAIEAMNGQFLCNRQDKKSKSCCNVLGRLHVNVIMSTLLGGLISAVKHVHVVGI